MAKTLPTPIDDKTKARLLGSVDVRGPDECWPWKGYSSLKGYGQFSAGNTHYPAHRVFYEVVVGPIPEGLVTDHLCRNRICCNPSHLEPVTVRENTRRGKAGHWVKERALLITHCPQGHAYDAANTYVSKFGKRQCKTCHRERQRIPKALEGNHD